MSIYSSLTIPQIPLDVSLGITSEERATLQKVLVSLDLRFINPPLGAQNDLLQDTLNYATLAEQIETICHKKSYQLIEHLAYEIYQALKQNGIEIRVQIFKIKPPHRLLENGALFSYGDFT